MKFKKLSQTDLSQYPVIKITDIQHGETLTVLLHYEGAWQSRTWMKAEITRRADSNVRYDLTPYIPEGQGTGWQPKLEDVIDLTTLGDAPLVVSDYDGIIKNSVIYLLTPPPIDPEDRYFEAAWHDIFKKKEQYDPLKEAVYEYISAHPGVMEQHIVEGVAQNYPGDDAEEWRVDTTLGNLSEDDMLWNVIGRTGFRVRVVERINALLKEKKIVMDEWGHYCLTGDFKHSSGPAYKKTAGVFSNEALKWVEYALNQNEAVKPELRSLLVNELRRLGHHDTLSQVQRELLISGLEWFKDHNPRFWYPSELKVAKILDRVLAILKGDNTKNFDLPPYKQLSIEEIDQLPSDTRYDVLVEYEEHVWMAGQLEVIKNTEAQVEGIFFYAKDHWEDYHHTWEDALSNPNELRQNEWHITRVDIMKYAIYDLSELLELPTEEEMYFEADVKLKPYGWVCPDGHQPDTVLVSGEGIYDNISEEYLEGHMQRDEDGTVYVEGAYVFSKTGKYTGQWTSGSWDKPGNPALVDVIESLVPECEEHEIPCDWVEPEKFQIGEEVENRECNGLIGTVESELTLSADKDWSYYKVRYPKEDGRFWVDDNEPNELKPAHFQPEREDMYFEAEVLSEDIAKDLKDDTIRDYPIEVVIKRSGVEFQRAQLTRLTFSEGERGLAHSGVEIESTYYYDTKTQKMTWLTLEEALSVDHKALMTSRPSYVRPDFFYSRGIKVYKVDAFEPDREDMYFESPDVPTAPEGFVEIPLEELPESEDEALSCVYGIRSEQSSTGWKWNAGTVWVDSEFEYERVFYYSYGEHRDLPSPEEALKYSEQPLLYENEFTLDPDDTSVVVYVFTQSELPEEDRYFEKLSQEQDRYFERLSQEQEFVPEGLVDLPAEDLPTSEEMAVKCVLGLYYYPQGWYWTVAEVWSAPRGESFDGIALYYRYAGRHDAHSPEEALEEYHGQELDNIGEEFKSIDEILVYEFLPEQLPGEDMYFESQEEHTPAPPGTREITFEELPTSEEDAVFCVFGQHVLVDFAIWGAGYAWRSQDTSDSTIYVKADVRLSWGCDTPEEAYALKETPPIDKWTINAENSQIFAIINQPDEEDMYFEKLSSKVPPPPPPAGCKEITADDLPTDKYHAVLCVLGFYAEGSWDWEKAIVWRVPEHDLVENGITYRYCRYNYDKIRYFPTPEDALNYEFAKGYYGAGDFYTSSDEDSDVRIYVPIVDSDEEDMYFETEDISDEIF